MAHEPPYDEATYVPSSGRFLAPKCPPKEGGLVFVPDVLFYSFTDVGEVTDWQTFTVTNTGPANIGIADLDIDNIVFEMEAEFPVIVQPGETLEFNVRFRPAVVGQALGYVILETADTDPQPKIRLIGLGGTLTGGPVQGSPEEIETIVNELIEHKWAYRYGTFAPGGIVANELLLDYHVTTTHTIQPNFVDFGISVGTPPSEEYVLTVMRGVEIIGTITIHPNGSIVRMTTDGLAINVPVNSWVSIHAPAVPDDVISRLRITCVGVVS